MPRAVWAIGAFIGEYDVPQCAAGTPPQDCKHEIWGVVTPGGDNLHIAAMHFHCHAPTCLAMEISNNRTGELLCRQEARAVTAVTAVTVVPAVAPGTQVLAEIIVTSITAV